MSKATKLPSGNYNRRVYDYTDATGKRVYRSFTAPTAREVNYMAAQFTLQKKRMSGATEHMTLNDAITKYIDSCDAILSPKTIEEYRKIQKHAFQELMDMELVSLTPQILAEAVNREAKRPSSRSKVNPKPISAKTVRNEYGLIASVIRRYCPDADTRVTLPSVQPKFKTLLPPEIIFDVIKGEEIELAVLLAMWLSFTASEIRGLKRSSIVGDYIQIDQVIVDVNNVPVEKTNAKVDTRKRRHKMPAYIKELIDALPPDQEYLVPIRGHALTKRWTALLKKHGLPHMTFHDLRHINASVMASLHVPEKYIMQRGGWKSDKIMKQVYTHTLEEDRIKADQMIDEYFEKKRTIAHNTNAS